MFRALLRGAVGINQRCLGRIRLCREYRLVYNGPPPHPPPTRAVPSEIALRTSWAGLALRGQAKVDFPVL